MAPRARVSVVIPTYNRGSLLPRAIRSVLNQTFTDFELIVVDDASTDDTQRVVKGFSDLRVRYFRHERNRGGAAARNTGIGAARGEFIAFLDSDDEWLETRLAEQIGQGQSTTEDFGVFYCNVLVVDGRIVTRRDSANFEGSVRADLLGGWCPSTISCAVVRIGILSGNAFDSSLQSFQDYDLWLSLSEITKFKYLPRALVLRHRHSGDQLSINPKRRKRALEALEQKWLPRLTEEEATLFQGFLRKHRQTIALNELRESIAGRSVLGAAAILLRNMNKGLDRRGLALLGIKSLLGPSQYERLRIWNYKRKGRFVGYYGQDERSALATTLARSGNLHARGQDD